MEQVNMIKKLIEKLNKARDEYYNNANPSISDKEYDKLFDKLVELEKETGIYMSNSPTQTVGYEVKSKLEKIKHSHPMLSLDKTKDVNDLIAFSSGRDCIISLKLDGLTILNTYNNNTLVQAETRGNGEEGEIVTHNARVFDNLPSSIPYDSKFEIEGEAIITYSDFEEINLKLSEEDKYKNPRNLASGSVRQLDSNVTKNRHVRFVAWKVPFGVTTYSMGFDIAARYGFEVVPYEKYNSSKDDISEIIERLEMTANEKGYPIDGLVITYDNVEYGKSLGMTGHHPKHSLAFKFYDDEYETTLKEIEWSMGKTGILTPIAIFEPVEIDGSTVERASVHNISILTKLDLRSGDTITVYKANQIIPQIADNLSIKEHSSSYMVLPSHCPICGGIAEIRKENDTMVLVCTNDDCQGKLLGKLSHAVSKNALNIDGLSEATLEFMIKELNVKSIKDLYQIPFYKEVYERWIGTSGFGKRSVDKLREAINKSKNTTLERFLYAQSINLIGRSASRDIAKYCNGNIDMFCEIISCGRAKEFVKIDGFGETMYQSLINWYDKHWIEFLDLKKEFNFESGEKTKGNGQENNSSYKDLKGKSFCITGKLEHCSNREELVAIIEASNGKYVTGVTSKTDCLVNNDLNSTTGKNKKAKDLNIPIISEKELLKMVGVL